MRNNRIQLSLLLVLLLLLLESIVISLSLTIPSTSSSSSLSHHHHILHDTKSTTMINNDLSIINNINNNKKRQLPPNLIIGYCNWSQCDEKVTLAVQDGVNVLIWFAINFESYYDKNLNKTIPIITNGPNFTCVANKIKELKDIYNLNPINLISIGGWNSPHPTTNIEPEVFFEYFNHWNRHIISTTDFNGFDGIDWDIEGNDDINSPNNLFTIETLNWMGKFSELASNNNYIVSMAPAESYIDPSTSEYSLSLLHDYPEYSTLQPDFKYHGRNVYAYLLSKYNNSFDFITIQLYEGYSHALYNLYYTKTISVSEYLYRLIMNLKNGWMVNYNSVPELMLESQIVAIEPHRLVIGLANGWAGDGKFLLIYPDDLQEAYNYMKENNIILKGFAFWNILDEGKISVQNTEYGPVWLAKELNSIINDKNVN